MSILYSRTGIPAIDIGCMKIGVKAAIASYISYSSSSSSSSRNLAYKFWLISFQVPGLNS